MALFHAIVSGTTILIRMPVQPTNHGKLVILWNASSGGYECFVRTAARDAATLAST